MAAELLAGITKESYLNVIKATKTSDVKINKTYYRILKEKSKK